MSSSASLNIQEILLCLKNTYSSPDKAVREQSEKKLDELKNQDIVEFTSQLIQILRTNTSEIDKNLKLSIILLLKRSLKEKIEKEEITKDQVIQLIQQFILLLVNPSLSKKELENLIVIFSLLLEAVNEEVLIEIIKYINKEISSMPLGSCNGVISIIIAVISSQSISKKNYTWILTTTLEMGYGMLSNLYREFEKINFENNLDDYLKLNDMFSNFFEFLFIGNFKSSKRFKIKEEKIENLFYSMFIIGAKLLVNIKSNNDNKIISWTDNDKFDKNINTLKIKIIKFLNLQINDFGDFIYDKNKIGVISQLTKIIMTDLGWIIMNKYSNIMKLETEDENKLYKDNNYSLLIAYMFIYLKRVLKKDNFIKEFTSEFNNMYKNILLPLLINTQLDEEIAFENDTVNGYIIDINDILNENKNKNIKSTVAALIKLFYEKNNISNEFIIKYTLGLLEFLIKGNNNYINDKNIFNENDIIIILLKAYNKEKIITTLFLVLNIISEIDNEQNDLYLRDFFQSIFDFCLKIDNIILKHQIIIFISNYSLRFFESDSIAFESNISYLFNSLFDINNPLISNSASDALQNFFKKKYDEDPNIKTTILKAAINNFNNFEKGIKNVRISNFFEILYQILINFDRLDNDFFIKIFEKICNRINVEEERHRRLKFKVKKEKNKIKKKAMEQTNSTDDYNIIINKCFNIIRMLMNSKIFVVKNETQIEQCLTPLIQYMENPEKIDFDEDLVNSIYLLIIHTNKITPISFNLLLNLHKYCKKISGILLDMYELLNAYLAYGTDQILGNDNYLNALFLSFQEGIKSTKFKNSPFYTCLLIQTWIINCDKINQKFIADLVDIIIQKIFIIIKEYNANENNNLGDDNYNFLGFVTLIIAGLINYSNVIINQLNKYSCASNLKGWLDIINNENEPGFEYEIKILIYSISTIIQRNILKDDIGYLLNVCIELLNSQGYNAKFELKKETKKLFNNFKDDEQSDEEDNSYEEMDDYQEIKDLIKRTINPIKAMDEFKIFNDLLIYLKNNRNDIYIKWENSLNEKQKQNIYKLLGTKRINITINKKDNVQVPRRIVSIKRNINNSNNQ